MVITTWMVRLKVLVPIRVCSFMVYCNSGVKFIPALGLLYQVRLFLYIFLHTAIYAKSILVHVNKGSYNIILWLCGYIWQCQHGQYHGDVCAM